MRMPVLFVGLLMLLVTAPAMAQTRRPIKVTDLFRFQRLGDPQVSPDGTQVAYTVTRVDLDHNSTRTNIWVVGTARESKPRQLTNSTKADRHPRWSPDSKKILFESSRSGAGQLWVIDLEGGEATQLTRLSTGASTGIWSPDGKKVAFVSAVYPEFSAKPFKESDAANKKRKEAIDKDPVKARVFNRLFFRHWDSWVEDKRQHLFVTSATGGDPLDVTPGDRDAYPTSSTFSVGDDFTFAPDGSHLVFTAVPEKDEAWNTNYDLCRVSVKGGEVENLTKHNPAADGAPRFSPDGKHLAYRAQKRPGFEADRWELMLVECTPDGRFAGKPHSLTPHFDSWVGDFCWADVDHIILTAEVQARGRLFRIKTSGRPGLAYADGQLKTSADAQEMANPAGTQASPSCDHKATVVACTLSALNMPPEICIALMKEEFGVEPVVIRGANERLLKELDLPRPESVEVPAADGARVQMWILKPPGFEPAKKWPLVFLVHGGPQGAWEDAWSNRWNPEVWAAQGYVIALPNPRGSTGFGQKFVDEISGDWGGKCFDDLMACLAYLEKQPYIDRTRMASAGASFGGYMMNWFQGHTHKFKTLITHCGVFNFDSMYATTDEVWFDEWEHGGPPWARRDSYEKHSPHRFARNFKTPMLIIHNDLDFRVPMSEGYQLFTTLQRLGVPSRLVNFPDEGHWVLKPANSQRRHQEVFDWLKQYVPPGAK